MLAGVEVNLWKCQ